MFPFALTISVILVCALLVSPTNVQTNIPRLENDALDDLVFQIIDITTKYIKTRFLMPRTRAASQIIEMVTFAKNVLVIQGEVVERSKHSIFVGSSITVAIKSKQVAFQMLDFNDLDEIIGSVNILREPKADNLLLIWCPCNLPLVDDRILMISYDLCFSSKLPTPYNFVEKHCHRLHLLPYVDHVLCRFGSKLGSELHFRVLEHQTKLFSQKLFLPDNFISRKQALWLFLSLRAVYRQEGSLKYSLMMENQGKGLGQIFSKLLLRANETLLLEPMQMCNNPNAPIVLTKRNDAEQTFADPIVHSFNVMVMCISDKWLLFIDDPVHLSLLYNQFASPDLLKSPDDFVSYLLGSEKQVKELQLFLLSHFFPFISAGVIDD